MFMIGDALAGAIIAQAPDRFSGRDFAFSPATDLRLQIDRLLGAHTELAALAMRARLSDASDVDASVAALNQNTADLTAAISSIYGDTAGAAFEQQWRDHTDFYLAYVAAKKANDTSAQTTALNGLRNYQTTFTAFLVKANPLLSETRFRQLIGEHTDHIINEADQYAVDSFSPAYQTERAAFQHSGVLSAYLAAAIADQFPNRFPNTSIEGGLSPLTVIGLALVLIAGLLVRPRLRRVARARIGQV
jgi:cytochrome c556